MLTLVKNGIVVREVGPMQADVLIDDEHIVKIGKDVSSDADKIIDAEGKYLFPGFIDTHTHFDLDLGVTVTADNFATGTAAALAGGTTAILDFCTQDKGMTMHEALDRWNEKSKNSSCNYGFHMAVSEWNDAIKAEVKDIISKGISSFKMYMVYDSMRVNDGQIYDALKYISGLGGLIGVHCENFDVLTQRIKDLHSEGLYAPRYHPISRPNAVEAEGVARLMRIAELAKAPAWVVHLSTAEGLAEAKRARERGQNIFLETCPQYLVLDSSAYEQADGEKFIMSPPLRQAADRKALLCAMSDGDIDFTGTDHCSFTMAQKALGHGDFAKVPNGGAGVQNRAELIYTFAVLQGYIGVSDMAKLMSTNAAKIFGMYPERGVIEVGSIADIAIFDPNSHQTISYKTNLHNCDNSPYEGICTQGQVTDVLLSGKHVLCNGELIMRGQGRYIARGLCNTHRR
ncbi:MAG TPA: dihydropyrimidinase [Clostridia bacterium]|nr:dihydropyrimidinase [Clostridia bacterium]